MTGKQAIKYQNVLFRGHVLTVTLHFPIQNVQVLGHKSTVFARTESRNGHFIWRKPGLNWQKMTKNQGSVTIPWDQHPWARLGIVPEIGAFHRGSGPENIDFEGP